MSTDFQPTFTPSPGRPESAASQAIIDTLVLQPNIEGGYFVETDRDSLLIPSPFQYQKTATTDLVDQRPGFDPAHRNASTTIYYFLTPTGSQGGLHRNKGRIIHTLHKGRGRYVIIHADESGKEKRVETFVVGSDIAKGERLQWIVDGGKYKASFLLPDVEGGTESEGLLISETTVPGFEYCDHDFLSPQGLKDLVRQEKAEELKWLLSPHATGH